MEILLLILILFGGLDLLTGFLSHSIGKYLYVDVLKQKVQVPPHKGEIFLLRLIGFLILLAIVVLAIRLV
ncbi:hypothetical protein GCM10008090_24750 [Arenicella chitinivorans]|uniref:Uncharacterized protein n=1 Tax=Arenicella chitinivorans TaxID=1329800 RepID=A0A918RVD8_9GAMM|nr:hypothetical protein GCM10008090_24750 [Arenicella chitinivorans]